MNKMVFGTFTWPENPEIYEEICTREPVYTKNDSGETVYSGLSAVRRTMKGSGVFAGSDAYAQFKTLAALVSQTTAAKLNHPVWGERSAYLMEIKSTMMPRENYVAYSFTFLEADSKGAIPN